MVVISYELVQVWRKSYIEIDENEEDIRGAFEEGDVYESEYLYETEELIEPKEGEATLEIYDETGDDLLYSNKK